MGSALFRLCEAIIRCGSFLVPGPARREWRDEWVAELAHSWPQRSGASLVRRCLGAFPDGLCLFADAWLPSLHPEALVAAIRHLARTPLLLSLNLVALAVAVGITAALLSSATALLLAPAPFPGAEDCVRIENAVRIDGASVRPFSREEFDAIRDGSTRLESVSAFRRSGEQIATEGKPCTFALARVSSDYLDLFAFAPILGRTLAATDWAAGAEPVVVISERLWRDAFGRSRGALGRVVVLEGSPHRIVGILPRASFPGEPASAWAPLASEMASSSTSFVRMVAADGIATQRDLRVVARLKPGAHPDDARREIAVALAGQSSSCATVAASPAIDVVRVVPPLRERVPRAMWIALGAAVLLVLGLGASAAAFLDNAGARTRLSRAVVLGLPAGIASIPIGILATGAIAALTPARVGFTAPAWHPAIAGLAIVGALIAMLAAPRVCRDAVRTHWRRTMELAFAAALLVACGSAARSSRDGWNARLGFDDERALAASVQFGEPVRVEVAERARRAACAVEGVEHAGIAVPGPLDGIAASVSVTAAQPGSPTVETCLRFVDDHYCEAMGLAVRGSDRVADGALVNESLARRLWPALEDPLGRPVWISLDERRHFPVVGIVPDVPQSPSTLATQPEVMISLKWSAFDRVPDPRGATVIVRPRERARSSEVAANLQHDLRRDPEWIVHSVRDFEAARENAEKRPRAASALAGLGSILGLALAGLGIVPSYRVPGSAVTPKRCVSQKSESA